MLEESGFTPRRIEFANKISKDSQLDALHKRVEDSCQSESQIHTDALPHQTDFIEQGYCYQSQPNQIVDIKNIQQTVLTIQDSSYQNQTINNTQLQTVGQEILLNSHYSNRVGQENKGEISATNKNKIQTSLKIFNGGRMNLELPPKLTQSQHSVVVKDIFLFSKIKKQMMKFYKEKTLSGKNFNLNNLKIRSLINDQSDYIPRKLSFYSKYCKIVRAIVNFTKQKCSFQIPLFSPQNSFKFGFDIFSCIVNCWFFIFSSILIVFQVSLSYEYQLYDAMYLLWIMQIIIKLNTTIYDKTKIVQNRKAIAKEYFRDYALYDLVPFLLKFIPPEYSSARLFFKIIQFIKVRNLISKMNIIQHTMCMLLQNYYLVQLIKLVLKVLVFAHVIACLWYLVGVIELSYLGEEETWFDKGIGADRNWMKLYISAFYWTLTLMTTGSNEASTAFQITFTSVIMIFTTIIFGYILNVIGIVLTEIDQEEEKERRDINYINRYMRQRCISKDLQRAINLDLEYYYSHNFKKDEEQIQIALAKISTNLFHDLKREYFSKFLKNIPFISTNFSQETLQKLLLCMEEHNFLPGQVLNIYSNIKESSLIYVIEGQVELIKTYSSESSNAQFVIDVIGKDKVIGQIPFFQGRTDGNIMKTSDFTTILSISRENFLEIIQQNDEDYQLFCYIKDHIGLYENFEHIGIKCDLCKKYTHNQTNCPLVHFNKSDASIKFNYNKSFLQQRSTYKRRVYHSYNAIWNQSQTLDDFQLYNMNNNMELFYVISPCINHSEDPNKESASSEKDFEILASQNKIFTATQIKIADDEDGRVSIPEKQKSIKRQTLKKRGSQQMCMNIDSQLSSMQQDDSSSNCSGKEKYQKEGNTTIKQLETSNTNLIQTQPSSFNQSNLLKFQTSQQMSQKFNKIEFILKKLQMDILGMAQADEFIPNQQNPIEQGTNELWEFDSKKDYTIYFPEGNSEKVIAKFNQRIVQKIKKLKRRKKNR